MAESMKVWLNNLKSAIKNNATIIMPIPEEVYKKNLPPSSGTIYFLRMTPPAM
jgi:hypothetical protein